MSIIIRDLTTEDFEDVRSVSISAWEHDYVPTSFLDWLDDPHWYPIGIFVDEKLLSFGVLQRIENRDYGWVKALRTHKNALRKGYGFEVVKHMIARAKELGFKELCYATTTNNIASVNLALKVGFTLIDSIGLARIHKPYPAHPKPSPNLIPLKVDAERIYEAIVQNPELVPTELIPMAWEFYNKDTKGIKRMGEEANFFLVISDDGITQGLYFTEEFTHDGKNFIGYTIYCQDRGVFVDIISRAMENVESREMEGAGFSFGPNGSEWVKDMAIFPDDREELDFLHYKLKL